ncbi:ABC transporter permease subunit [Siculibacillus lacustris]|uniref:ABC transporter permease subunit n=1 Tax=Siculibacillus lacustris TaxID=1549641 RepID=A0A4Q9VQ38_9HYPH|nr:ABC transporter permease subunit [Siculibacillus lacustris]TBW37370.1 ABC transporter permease subunit [Siculibacillus lacustris]
MAVESTAAEALTPPNPLRLLWADFSTNRGAVLGLALISLVLLLAAGADVISSHDPMEQFRAHVLQSPVWAGGTWEFPLGTDDVGRDMASRIVHGARYSLFIGFSVVVVSLAVGVCLGLAAAFMGGIVDTMISRLMDLIMSVPSLVLAIVVIAVIGPSLTNTIVAVTVVYMPRYVRIVRATAQAEMSKDYVTASRAAGVGPFRLAFVTVLPNCMAPLIVQAALGISDAILEAAALGFLGLGAQPPTPEWGAMLSSAREFIQRAPHVVTLPGVAILITVVSINLMGDGLRDALDPKLKRS